MIQTASSIRLDQPVKYCIKVQGRLDEKWSDWFDVSAIRVARAVGQAPVTTLTVDVADQAELYGMLARLRDLGLPLLLVKIEEENL